MTRSDELRVVRFGPERSAEVAELERRCFPAPWSEETIREVLSTPFCRGLGAEELVFGLLVGYAISAIQEESCHLLDLGVSPEWRRSGVGSELVAEALADAATLGATEVFLEVRESNRAAQALYAGFGFAPGGRRNRYYPDTGEDALILTRDVGGRAARH